MDKTLSFAAVVECATGFALLMYPSLAGQLLMGADLTGIAISITRVMGIALIALGVACWPGPPILGMFLYSTCVAAYLAYLGLAERMVGILLWPAVAIHCIFAVLLARSIVKRARSE